MNFELLKKAIAESAAELGITEYEIYYESEASVSAETLKDEISSLSSNVSGALDFRCVVDGKMGFASTELMEVEEMRKLPARAAENAKYTDKPDTVGIFILPPSRAELVRRLTGRGTETKEQLETRIRNAEAEIRTAEKFPYLVVNATLSEAVRQVRSVIEAENLRDQKEALHK